MIKRQYWKYFIYLVMALYITYVAMSIYFINALVQKGQSYAIRANQNIEEIRARAREFTANLPVLLASSEMSLKELKDTIATSTESQRKSFENLKDNFQGNPEELRNLETLLNKIAQSKRDAVKRLEGNNSYELALVYYRHNIAPLLEDLQLALNLVYQSVDTVRNQIHDRMHRHLNLVILSTIIAGFIIVCVTILYDRSEAAFSRKLAYRDELFKLLGTAVDEIFIITNGSGIFEYASPNCERLLGFSSADLKENPGNLYSQLNPEGAEWLREHLDSPPAAGQHIERDLKNIGENRFFKAQIFTIQLPSTRQTRTIIVLNDQTDTRLHQLALSDALENAHAASEAKSSFLSHMSHEIRTPMNAIIGMTTIALSRIADRARVEDCLGKISASSRHLLRLINDVLDMSKIESGKLTICNDKFSLHKVVDNIQNTFQPQIQAKNQNFRILLRNVEEEELIGDAMRIDQVLLNILSNAIKFTPEYGTISVEIEQLNKSDTAVQFRFTITDTGIGMSPEFLERIYVPFEQAHTSTASKYGGTGLGMPITANLIAMMGGTINVKSQEGKGSTFTIVLPFGISHTQVSENGQPLPRLNVLVINDDPDLGSEALAILGRLGQKASYASSGQDALSLARREHETNNDFHIAIIEWNMADMPVTEISRELDKIAGEGHISFIISSHTLAGIEDAARDAGFRHFVSQPFFSSSLHEALASFTQSRPSPEPENGALVHREFDFSGKRILLAEDNDFNREIAKEFLEMVNASLDFAENGREALDKFLTSPPGFYDIILMDIQMPVMDGYEATRQIRASTHRDAKTINIIAMTANAFHEDVSRAMAAGMNAHIAKPIDIKLLYALLDEHFPAAS